MNRFDSALDHLLKTEGGFVFDLDDKGGPTNLGITLVAWRDYFGKEGTPADIMALTPKLVAPIYRKLYWDRFSLDNVASPFAEVFFDQVVLHGRAAIYLLQGLLKIKQDGNFGPKTLAAVKLHPNPKRLSFEFVRASQRDYVKICVRFPTQLKFLGGWTDRLFALVERYLLWG